MKTLLTGPDGQIGYEILSAWDRKRLGEIVPLSIEQCDFSNVAELRRCVREIKPDLIINASGYTAVDRAETEPELTRAINVTAVEVLGEEARRLGAAVVHYSTDYVFDGRKRTPYTPDDQPNPQGVYAQTKLDGEIALVNSGAPYLIIRTAWIYGGRGRNFLLAMLRLAAQKPELKIVNDQTGSPTWCRSVARRTIEMINKALAGVSGDYGFGGHEGVYHLTAGGATTWIDFARRIFELTDVPNKPRLVPISTAEYGAKAARPGYSVLDCSRTLKTFDVSIPPWNVGLEEFLGAYKGRLHELIAQPSGGNV